MGWGNTSRRTPHVRKHGPWLDGLCNRIGWPQDEQMQLSILFMHSKVFCIRKKQVAEITRKTLVHSCKQCYSAWICKVPATAQCRLKTNRTFKVVLHRFWAQVTKSQWRKRRGKKKEKKKWLAVLDTTWSKTNTTKSKESKWAYLNIYIHLSANDRNKFNQLLHDVFGTKSKYTLLLYSISFEFRRLSTRKAVSITCGDEQVTYLIPQVHTGTCISHT